MREVAIDRRTGHETGRLVDQVEEGLPIISSATLPDRVVRDNCLEQPGLNQLGRIKLQSARMLKEFGRNDRGYRVPVEQPGRATARRFAAAASPVKIVDL